MTLGELSQRLRRADFLDGLGIYVGPHEVALVHITKRFFRVAVRNVATYPLPDAAHPAERRQAIAEAVGNFARSHKVETRRTYLCLPRTSAILNRFVLPVAARENLAQVIEYQIEQYIPLTRDEVYFDYSVRDVGEDRIEVLVMCLPRSAAQLCLDALEAAGVRPRGIVMASTAIADYLAFCRGDGDAPMGIVLDAENAVELALVREGRLLASQLIPATRANAPGGFARSLARQLGDVMLAPDDVPLYRWALANGHGSVVLDVGEGDLMGLAAGKLEGPPELFERADHALLPAVGAALDAVREGTVDVNLLPVEGRHRDDGLGLTTLVLAAMVLVLGAVWGTSALVKDEVMRRQLRAQIEEVSPRVREVKALQAQIEDLNKQIEVLTAGEDERLTLLLKEVTDLIPADAYLTSLNLRGGRLTLDGQARAASDLITALEKSKHFKNVSFTSPTTRSGDKERFALVAEVEK